MVPIQSHTDPVHTTPSYLSKIHINIVTYLISALSGNSSVNMVQHATTEEAVFSVDPTDEPIDWLDSDHVICVYSIHVRSAAM
jgi:hypothetical protein